MDIFLCLAKDNDIKLVKIQKNTDFLGKCLM